MREHGGVSPPLEMLRGPLLPPGTDFRLLQEARPARHPGAGQPQGQVRRGKHSPGTLTTDPAWWQPDRLRGAVRVRARLQLRWRGRPLCPGARVRHGRPRAPDRGPGNSSLQPGHSDLALTRWAACPRSDSAPPSSRTGRGCPVSALLRVGAVSSASPSDAIRGEGREG